MTYMSHQVNVGQPPSAASATLKIVPTGKQEVPFPPRAHVVNIRVRVGLSLYVKLITSLLG